VPITKTPYVKSCLNYTGGKYKLLNQLFSLFPENIHNFVDLFCGGANVLINMEATGTMTGIDNQKEVIRLYETLKTYSEREILDLIYSIISEFQLSETRKFGYSYYGCDSSSGVGAYNKLPFLKLRDTYNSRTENNCYYDTIFYLLTVYGFNNQIRFNKNMKFNIPVGKRDFNEKIEQNLLQFMRRIKEKNVNFICSDFRNIDYQLTDGDFLYADPPYLISTASYNEQGGWTEQDERDLLNFLDDLDRRNVKFALSNVTIHKGKENTILIDWSKKYHCHYLDYDYNNSNYQSNARMNQTQEVLITNY